MIRSAADPIIAAWTPDLVMALERALDEAPNHRRPDGSIMGNGDGLGAMDEGELAVFLINTLATAGWHVVPARLWVDHMSESHYAQVVTCGEPDCPLNWRRHR